MSGVSQSIRYTAQNLGNMADQIVKQITDKIEWLYMNIIDGILSFRRYLADGLAYIGDQVRASIAAFTVTIRRAINGMIDRVMEGLGGINERVRITAANTINQVHAASRGIQTYLNNTFMWFKRDLLGGIGAQVTALAQGGMNFVQQALTGVSRALGEGLQDLFEWLWKGATDTAARIVSFLSEDILAPIAAGLEGTAKWFGTIMDTGIEQVFELLEEPVGDEEDAAQAKAIKLLKLAGGISIPFAMSILAGELVHPLKSLGLGQVAAIAYDVGGFGVIARDIVKVVTEVSAIIPLRVALMEKAVPMVPFEEQLIQLASKRVMPQEDFTRMMRKSGFNEYWSDLFWETSWFKPRFPELQVMRWRGAIGEEQFNDAMTYNSIPPEWLPFYEAIIPQIPGPGDLVRFAVREAFTRPELQVEYPTVFGEYMQLHGFSDLWARFFWASHWVLVPLAQLYQMFHRGMIDAEVLALELKYADYTPEWREKLIALSWNLPGRIDARWLFRWGIIDVDGLMELLIKGGLDPFYAPDVAMATARQQFQPELNRLRDNTKRDYVKGYVLDDQLEADLVGLGYPPAWIEFHIQDALEDGRRAYKDAIVDAIGDGYMKDLVNEAELERELGNVIVRPEALQIEIERLYIRKYKKAKPATVEKIKVLPVTTLLRAYRERVIDVGALEEELLDRGQLPEDVALIIELEDRKLQAELEKVRVTPRVVSVATLLKAFREELMVESTLRSELLARRYTPEDVELIVSLELARVKPKTVSVATLRKAYQEDIITEDALVAELTAREYSQEDIRIIVDLEILKKEKALAKTLAEEIEVVAVKVRVLSVSTLRAAFREDVITEDHLRAELAERGYSPEDVQVIVELELARKGEPEEET